ncbi:MAG: type II toxin-antitoxin system RelE/ParE family toxin [Chloroflexi bacterium]|nr:type II toxin-antitoxin system RelE/ParE family toxin [Chloroflexota bacterium]
MDYKIIWTPRSIDNLKELVEYGARDNPSAARRIGAAIFKKTWWLGQFPRLGKVFAKLGRDDVREVLVRPYRIIYRVQDAARSLSILTIWHGARETPDVHPDEML